MTHARCRRALRASCLAAAAAVSLTTAATGCASLLGRHASRPSPEAPPSALAPRASSNGDVRLGAFAVGDRVVLVVPGVAALTDTFVVRAGDRLELPNIPPITLAGVSRSALQPYLRTQLARFVIDTSAIQAHTLLQVGVLGEVANPGYYTVPPDAVIADVLMRAGGLTKTADAGKIDVDRGKRELLSSDRMRRAIATGATVDELGLRAGDAIVVGARRDWGEIARTGAIVGGVVVSLLIGQRVF